MGKANKIITELKERFYTHTRSQFDKEMDRLEKCISQLQNERDHLLHKLQSRNIPTPAIKNKEFNNIYETNSK